MCYGYVHGNAFKILYLGEDTRQSTHILLRDIIYMYILINESVNGPGRAV